MGNTATGIAIMLVATSMTNTAAVLQKKAVDGLPAFDRQPLLQSIRDVLRTPLWVVGWAMAAVAIVLNMVALGLADISIIQPLNGFGLVVLAVVSRLVLGERIRTLAGIGMSMVISGVVVVGLAVPESHVFKTADEILASYTHTSAVVVLAAMLGVLGGLWLLGHRTTRVAGILFSFVAAGCSVIGLTFSKGYFGLLTLNGMSETLARPPAYLLLVLLLLFSTLAMIVQQLSFQKGRAVVVTPVFAATSVLLSLLFGASVFGESIGGLSLAATLLILVGVVLLGLGADPQPLRHQDGDTAPGICQTDTGRYHTNDELLALTRELATRAFERASLEEIGTTVAGTPILAVRVAASGRIPSSERAQALVCANIHGNEVITSEVALHLLDLLTADSPGDPAQRLLEQADVTVVPSINLDSREAAAAALAQGRLRASAKRGNRNGVDLNRNFPFPEGAQDAWHPLSGTTVRWLPWYRGDAPFSEPETRALRDLAQKLSPRAALNLHSVGHLFLYPYCYKAEAPADLAAFTAMGDAFVAAQPHRPYRIKQSRAWYTILGDMDDWLYDTHGTLSVTLELSGPVTGAVDNPLRLFSSLAWMNPPTTGHTVDNTGTACLEALRVGIERSDPASS
ncbi:MAG: M14 family zinc carboxypeptidase [Myxococcota bacterium]